MRAEARGQGPASKAVRAAAMASSASAASALAKRPATEPSNGLIRSKAAPDRAGRVSPLIQSPKVGAACLAEGFLIAHSHPGDLAPRSQNDRGASPPIGPYRQAAGPCQ